MKSSVCEGCKSLKTGALCRWCEDASNYELDENDKIETDDEDEE